MTTLQQNFNTEEDYYNLPEHVRAELIDGVLIYDQAAPSRLHQGLLIQLCMAIGQFISSKNGPCKVYPAPFAVKLWTDGNTIVEPDISVICDTDKLTDRGCSGAPDWIIEIVSPHNTRRDYITKLNLYLEAGVREYWIVDPRKESVMVYNLEAEDIEIKTYTFSDKIKVSIYDDFSIDFAALNP